MQAAITIKIVNSLISKYNKNLELRDGKQYASSRDFVAATGLVTRQYSTGGWTTLGKVVQPPVLYWRVTSPVAATKSRLLAYCFPSLNSRFLLYLEISELTIL